VEQGQAMSTATMAYKRVAAADPPEAIHTKHEHRHWTNVLRELMQKPETDAAEARYGETIALLIEAYEKQHFPVTQTTPTEVIAGLLALHDMKQVDLVRAGIYKTEGAVSLVMSGERELTRDKISALAALFNVSPAIFF
jgi:HTH-type transcriptional regulator / antitoxin HigA